jgi:hypothetical protein
MAPEFFLPASFTITGSLIWVLFAFVTTIWVIATLVLEYHWKNYAINEQKISSVRFLYRAGSFFLLAIIFLSVFSYAAL